MTGMAVAHRLVCVYESVFYHRCASSVSFGLPPPLPSTRIPLVRTVIVPTHGTWAHKQHAWHFIVFECRQPVHVCLVEWYVRAL